MILQWSITLLSFFAHIIDSTPLSGHRQPATLSPDILFQQTGILPKQHQVSEYLRVGETKRFVFLSEKPEVPLSIAVTPCSSVIIWTVYLAPENRSLISGVNGAKLLQEFTSSDLEIYKTTSSETGQYIVEMRTLDQDTHVQIFVSEEPLPPHSTRMAQKPKLRLQLKQRIHRITINWDETSIDPHVTEYCLVMSTRKNYTSLCGAHGDKYGPYGHGLGTVKGNTSKMNNNADREKGNVLISCVGSRSHHNIDNLKHGKSYYISLFAINKKNNLTFPYGSKLVEYNQKFNQSKLKDGKIESVNLKQLDGVAVFKFKAGKHTDENMTVSVMPCGGAVDVLIIKQGKPRKIVDQRLRLYSYGRLSINSVRRGERFRIEVASSNREELERTTGVEILATTKKRIPLPELPIETDVKEYTSMRSCQSVTVGWLPSPDASSTRYCVLTREVHRKEMELRLPNQCSLDKRLKSNNAATVTTQCFSRKQNAEKAGDRKKAITQQINNLKANRKYVVQVIVQKSTGKSLSYNLLTVQTSSECT